MSICAPTLECREEDPDTFDILYKKLDSVMKNVKSRYSLIIAGDFNAKIATNALESKQKTNRNIRKRKDK